MPSRDKGIGRRVLYLRAIAGLTQQQLAERVVAADPTITCTKQYISLIERGKAVVANRAVFDALVRAFGVSPGELSGQPYTATTQSDLTVLQVAPMIRAALDEPDEPTPPRSLAQLTVLADRAMMARMACDMSAIGNYLPGLIADTRTLWFERGDREAGHLLVKAAVTGSLAVKSVGMLDLGIRLAELADQVATALGDPICVAFARFAVAQGALAAGARRRSARIAAAGADDLELLTRSRIAPVMRNDALALLGILHLHAALADATLGTGDPDGHLAAADVVARHVDGDPLHLEVTPANVGIWRVGVALEGPNPEAAPDLAARVDLSQIRTAQRAERLYLDCARGHHARGDFDRTVSTLTAAYDAAPEDLRSRATAVELVRHLIHESRTRPAGAGDQLLALARGVGLNPDAVDE